METKPLSAVCNALLVLLFASTTFAGELLFEKSFPARGSSDIVVPLKSWGRFSFQVVNPEGTSLELIDKKIGTRHRSGSAGSSNGRIDDYLDVGTYKIKAVSSREGSGTASLKVYDYTEINSPQYIKPLKQYEGVLKDLEKVSYWIHVQSTQTLYLEALGRAVSDIQIWKNGQYREACSSTPISAYPTPETPLHGFRVQQELEPGYYQITVYGGKGAEWSTNGNEYPFYLKMNESRIGASGMGNYTIGNKGFEQFWVSADMKRAIVSLDKKEDIKIEVYNRSSYSPSYSRVASDSIHEKSREPRCIVSPYSGSGTYLVRVSGKAGTPFTLQTFQSMSSYISVDTSANYWLSTMHSGYAEDMLGVTGGVINRNSKGTILTSRFDTLSNTASMNRQFNLLERMNLYVWIEKDGEYVFEPHENMKLTIERYFYNRTNKRVSKFSGKRTVSLQRGLHEITLTPKIKGIATLRVYKKNSFSAMNSKRRFDKCRAVLQFPSLYLSRNKSYSLLVNSLSPEIGTVILRKLPVNTSEPLTIAMKKGEKITVPVYLSEESKIEARWSDGTNCPFVVDGNQMKSLFRQNAGEHTVELKADKDGFVSLRSLAVSLLPTAPAKPFPTGSESPLPIFKQINPEDTIYLDMKRSDKRTYEFIVKKPGIYEFATSGRLRTSLKLRDRFTLNLDNRSENGVGRNAQMMHYLLPGKYQAVVKTLGYSTGKMGLRLALIEKIDGGELTTLQEKRHKVPAGRAISYSVTVDEAGAHTLESQGQSGYFPIRFDDADGWPLVKPGSSGKITESLERGTYELVSLAQKRDRLRIARLTRAEDRVSYSGKGVHELKLNRSASSIWNEENVGEERKAAQFKLSVTAPISAKLSLTEDFTGTVYKRNEKLFSWSGTLDTLLPMGDLQIAVMADKEQNHKEYQLSVKTDMLIPGLTHSLYTGSTVNISVGSASVVELLSQGMLDVAATLYDSTGKKQLDYNDDGTNDWNFKISRLLNPGKYALKVTSRGKSGYAKILMRSLGDTLHTNLALGKSYALDMTGKINSVIYTSGSNSTVFQAELVGKSNVGALLERQIGDAWIEVGRASSQEVRLAVPTVKGSKYRLSFWSTDHLNEKVQLQLNSFSAENVTLDKLKRGIKSAVSKGEMAGYIWYLVDLNADSLGHFSVETKGGMSLDEVWSTSSTDTVFSADALDRVVASLSKKLWVGLKISGKTSETVTMKPLSLDEPIRVALGDTPRAFDLKEKKGYLTLFSAEMKMGTPLCGTPASKMPTFAPAGIGVHPGTLHYRNRTEMVLTPGDRSCVVLWNGDHQKGITTVTSALLSETLVPFKKGTSLQYGVNSVKVKKGSAIQSPLTCTGMTQVGIALAPYSIAVWKRADGTTLMKSSAKEVQYVTFCEDGGSLFLVNGGTDEKTMTVECRAVPKSFDKSYSLKDGLFEKKLSSAGTLSLSIDKTFGALKKAKVYSVGHINRIDWVRGDGFILRDLPSGFDLNSLATVADGVQGGKLLIHHGKGWVKLALSSETEALALWGDTISPTATQRVSRPEVMAMSETIEWYGLTAPEEKHLRLQSGESLVSVLIKDGKVIKTYDGIGTSSFDIPLPKGEYMLGVRRMGRVPTNGTTVDFSLYPIEELTDTVPLSITFAPGQSRILTFDLREELQIGLGVQTNREVVLVTLLDADRKVINQGQQQYLTLEKGKYYIQLTVPKGAEPAECTVKLFGQNPPADTPPANLVRKFRAYAK